MFKEKKKKNKDVAAKGALTNYDKIIQMRPREFAKFLLDFFEPGGVWKEICSPENCKYTLDGENCDNHEELACLEAMVRWLSES